MFTSFRRLLKRSKDREVPQSNENDSYGEANLSNDMDNIAANAFIALKLLHRPRPGLAAEISRLRRQHREFQRRFKQLPPCRPHVRRAKLLAVLDKMTDTTRSAAQPGRNFGRPLTSIDPSWLAARSTQKTKASKIPSYRGPLSTNTKTLKKSASLEAETSLDKWHNKGVASGPSVPLPSEMSVASIKQAASAHRMRRLREWSLTHGQDATTAAAEGEGEQDFVEAALVKIQQNGSTTTITPTANTAAGPRGAAALKDKAWSIMAGLSLENLDKKRGVSALKIAATVGASANGSAGTSGAQVPADAADDRRKTEPMNDRQHIGRKPSR
jgi:hypothetical protein